MLRQALREMDDAVAAATGAAARAIAARKLLLQEIDSQRASADQWQRSALAAVRSSDDDAARRALLRRRQHERLADVLQTRQEAAQATVARSCRRLDALKLQRLEANRLLTELAARQCAIRANRHLASLAPDGAAAGVFAHFDRWRQRIALAEAEAEALDELVEGHDSFTAGDEESAAIELELLNLKQRSP